MQLSTHMHYIANNMHQLYNSNRTHLYLYINFKFISTNQLGSNPAKTELNLRVKLTPYRTMLTPYRTMAWPRGEKQFYIIQWMIR